jgi:hypothetical protein
LGKPPVSGPRSVRVMPLISAVLLVAFDGLLAFALFGEIIGVVTDVSALGVPSLLTVSIMLTSIAFPISVAASLYIVYRERHAPMNRLVYWHAVLVTLAMTAVAIYYGYWGLFGLRFWAG